MNESKQNNDELKRPDTEGYASWDPTFVKDRTGKATPQDGSQTGAYIWGAPP